VVPKHQIRYQKATARQPLQPIAPLAFFSSRNQPSLASRFAVAAIPTAAARQAWTAEPCSAQAGSAERDAIAEQDATAEPVCPVVLDESAAQAAPVV
jgi:hypothetical protein